MLPYDGITRTGSKGVSHSVNTKTPSEARKVMETPVKSKPNRTTLSHKVGLAILRRCIHS